MLLSILWAKECRHKNCDKLPEMNTEEVMPVIKMMKNPCFGRCPIYAITLYNDGKVEYVGRDNVTKMGTFTKQIPTDTIAALLHRFHAIKFWEMQDRYKSELADSPKTIITLFQKDTSKTVRGDHSRPAKLIAIEKSLVALADSEEGWTKIEDHPYEQEKLPDYVIKDEIITKFAKDIDVERFVERHKKSYGLAIKKRVAPNSDLWLLSFDTNKINPAIMLIQLKRMPEVVEAEFNKRIKPREH